MTPTVENPGATGMLQCDAEGTIVFADSLLYTLGRFPSGTDITGKKIEILVPPSLRRRHEMLLRGVMHRFLCKNEGSFQELLPETRMAIYTADSLMLPVRINFRIRSNAVVTCFVTADAKCYTSYDPEIPLCFCPGARNHRFRGESRESSSAGNTPIRALAAPIRKVHDLRTPMQAAMLVLQGAMLEPMSPALQHDMNLMQQSLNELERILGEETQDANNQHSDPPGEVALSLAQAMAGALHESVEIAVMNFLSPGDDTRSIGNASNYKIVMRNLLDNAIKYTKKGRIVVKLWCHNDTIYFCIRDTGEGISPESCTQAGLMLSPLGSLRGIIPMPKGQPKSTKILHQRTICHSTPRSDERKVHSSGQGLVYLRSIANAEGWAMQFFSSRQQGTAVVVAAPLIKAFMSVQVKSRRLKVPNAVASPTPRKLRVLLVDDNPLCLSVMQMSIVRSGKGRFEVTTAKSAAEAIKALDGAHPPFEAMITDQQMGDGMSGIELTHHLLSQKPFPLTQCFTSHVVLLTGCAPEELHFPSKGLFYKVLTKPATVTDISNFLDVVWGYHQKLAEN